MRLTQPLRVAFAIAAVATSSILGCPVVRADEKTIAELANRFRGLPHCDLGGISVGVIDGGNSSLASAGMVHSKYGAPREIRDDDEFEIGSITKTFTATLYALALNEGKVTPEEPAQGLMAEGVALPVYRSALGKTVSITLDSLARHASGLPRALEGSPAGLSREQMVDELRSQQLLFPPGNGFLYSNLGFAVLSLAMERVYGDKIETLLPKMVAAPLGMNKTGVELSAFPAESVLQGYRPNGAAAPEQNPTWPAFDGASGLRSTPSDMLMFLRYNMKLSSAGSLTSLLPTLQKTEHLQGYGEDNGRPRDIGLAWQNATLPDGRHLIWKDGNVPGFRSFIGFTNTDPKTGVVVLSTQNGCKVLKLGRCIIESVDKTREDNYCANPDEGGAGEAGAP
jgi:serine-type D-Ala-D-Ala carboxypeptidase/endopeptidase